MKKTDIFNGFTLLVVLLVLITFFLNMYNGRFLLGDFKVYYSAASNFFNKGPVYMVSFYTGSGNYKYSPSTLFFFLPYLLFSFKTASVIHFFVLGLAYWYTFILLRKLVGDTFFMGRARHETGLISIAFVCILIHFARETYLGNINIVLLMLCCLSIRNFLLARHMQGGLLLGIAILTKPYLLVLVLPLLLRKKWKALGWLGIAVLVGLLLPFIFPGPSASAVLYTDWIRSILAHGEDFPGMTSLDYIARLVFPSWPPWGIFAIFTAVIGFVALFISDNIRHEAQPGGATVLTGMNFTFEWFLLIALLPGLIKTDWVLLLFSAPLITFLVFNIAARKQYRWIPALVFLIFFYGANSDDLLGRSLSHDILELGLMGMSNFLLAVLSLIMFLDLRKHLQTQ